MAKTAVARVRPVKNRVVRFARTLTDDEVVAIDPDVES
jgi:hypothetical protein